MVCNNEMSSDVVASLHAIGVTYDFSEGLISAHMCVVIFVTSGLSVSPTQSLIHSLALCMKVTNSKDKCCTLYDYNTVHASDLMLRCSCECGSVYKSQTWTATALHQSRNSYGKGFAQERYFKDNVFF